MLVDFRDAHYVTMDAKGYRSEREQEIQLCAFNRIFDITGHSEYNLVLSQPIISNRTKPESRTVEHEKRCQGINSHSEKYCEKMKAEEIPNCYNKWLRRQK